MPALPHTAVRRIAALTSLRNAIVAAWHVHARSPCGPRDTFWWLTVREIVLLGPATYSHLNHQAKKSSSPSFHGIGIFLSVFMLLALGFRQRVR